MGRVVCVFLSSMVLGACAAPHRIIDRDDYLAEATRSFPSQDRERVIRAAEAVLKQSDPDDWEFRYTAEGFTGLRRYFVYAVLASASGREKWEFNTELANPSTIKASISVSEAGVSSGGYSSRPYEGSMSSIPLYRLFWSRVDYVLGRSQTWTTCQEALDALAAKNENSLALSGLCGPTSDGRNASPPPQMAPSSAPRISAR